MWTSLHVLIMNDLQISINPLGVEVRANWDCGAGIGNLENRRDRRSRAWGVRFLAPFPCRVLLRRFACSMILGESLAS